MSRSKHTEAQMIAAVKQMEAGRETTEPIRTIYRRIADHFDVLSRPAPTAFPRSLQVILEDPRIGLRTINAKAETVTKAPAFREAFKYRRCLVPADAFYEWQKLDAKNKQPFAIAMKDGQPYALAGLWEKWKDRKANEELLTFTVITTDPNEVVEPLHDRMPVIIPAKDYDRWLKADPDRPPIDLLRPFDADKMNAWKVDKAVGNVKNETPELIEPPTSSEPSADEPPETPGLLFGS